MKTYVLNPTDAMADVELVDADGNKDTMFSMPGGRPRVPPGYTVSPRTFLLNPRLRLVEVPDEPVAAEVPTPVAAEAAPIPPSKK